MKDFKKSNSQSKHDIEYFIDQSHEKNKRESIANAVSLAEAGVHLNELQSYLSDVRALYVSLGMKVKSLLQSQAEVHLEQEKQSAEDLVKHQKRQSELAETKRILDADKRKLYIGYDWKKYWLFLLIELIIFCGETGFNAVAFAVMGGTVLASIPVAVVFAIVMGALAYFPPRLIKALPTHEERNKREKQFALGMLVLFFAVGILRAAVTQGNGLLESFSMSSFFATIIFVVINSAMFLGALLISVNSLPNKGDFLTKRASDKIEKKLEEIEEENLGITEKIEALQTELQSSKQERLTLQEQEAHFEKYVNALCEESVGCFQTEFRIKCTPTYSINHTVK